MTRRKGFTLIELLVVIAIIGILAAMLFPVFARARESARKIQCLSNVKNIAMAVQMYLADYDRYYPDVSHDPASSIEAKWVKTWTAEDRNCPGGTSHTGWENPYLRPQVILDEYIKNKDVWSCPSAKWDPSAWWIVPDYGGFLNYLISTHDAGLWVAKGSSPGGSFCAGQAFPPGWGGTVTDSIKQQAGNATPEKDRAVSITIGTSVSLAGTSPSNYNDPAWTVVCGDGTQFGNMILGVATMAFERCGLACGGADWTNCPQSRQCGLDPSAYNRWWTDPSYRRQDTRHMGGSNVGFADGHAKWFTAEALMKEHKYCGSPAMTGLKDVCCGTANPDGKLEGLCGKF